MHPRQKTQGSRAKPNHLRSRRSRAENYPRTSQRHCRPEWREASGAVDPGFRFSGYLLRLRSLRAGLRALIFTHRSSAGAPAPTNAANLKKALANAESSTHGTKRSRWRSALFCWRARAQSGRRTRAGHVRQSVVQQPESYGDEARRGHDTCRHDEGCLHDIKQKRPKMLDS
jgi:hypothetical protein